MQSLVKVSRFLKTKWAKGDGDGEGTAICLQVSMMRGEPAGGGVLMPLCLCSSLVMETV